MRLSTARSTGLFKVKVKVGEFFGEKPEALSVTIREPSIGEVQEYMVGDDAARMEGMKKLFPRCIVESDFEDEQGGPAKPEDVASLVAQSAILYGYVLQTWQEALPLEKRRAGNSGS